MGNLPTCAAKHGRDAGGDFSSARSFLHHQVRSMVGTLKLIGEGKWPETAVADALAARDRSRCGPTAPAAGLYLVRVGYDARPAAAAED